MMESGRIEDGGMAERLNAPVLKTDFTSTRKPHNFKQILLLASGLGCFRPLLYFTGFSSF
jgi:hypothetical protein